MRGEIHLILYIMSLGSSSWRDSSPLHRHGGLDPPSPTFLPFLFDKKGRKNQGRHQGPATQGGRLVSPELVEGSNHAPPPCRPWPARPTRMRLGFPIRITTFPQTRKGMDDISIFTEALAAMSCLRWNAHWRASMPAAYHCHSSYYENPTLHIGVW